MKIWQKILFPAVILMHFIATASAEDFNIKYSSNYLMPAYVHFKNNGSQYNIEAKINVPLYNIVFSSQGTEKNGQFYMSSYKDSRNGKAYATAQIVGSNIKYGKVKEQKSVEMTMPTFDLFTMAYQLSYYDKLPNSFQTTNGKKLYPTENVQLHKSTKNIKTGNGNTVQEITYRFRTSDNKDITVKKYAGEKFPRYIAYSRDGDNYKLEFSGFVK